MWHKISKQYQELFTLTGEELKLRSPGRVNLIGEHTDYNGGFVFPAAINLEIMGLAGPRSDSLMKVYSFDFAEMKEFDLRDIRPTDKSWINYIKGVAVELSLIKDLTVGANIVYGSSLPPDSGLSSSAAFELINGLILCRLNDINLEKRELALLAQRAENTFVGVNCGIMDQFAIALGEKDSALFLDTLSLDYSNIPLKSADTSIVIGNTNKARTLADSAYNQRRSECELAVAAISRGYPDIKYLRDVSPDLLKEFQAEMEPLIYKRARHVVEENERVKLSVDLLAGNDLTGFGQLMNASHDSLRDLYEVSCRELDVMVNAALRIDGVLGSRMTGAGFGGCTVSIVANDRVAEFKEIVAAYYFEQTGIKADFYISGAENGCEIIEA